MSMRMKVVFKNEFAKAKNIIRMKAENNLLEAANLIRNHLVENVLTGSRSGRTYRVPGTKKVYRASAPGEPPASVTGQLRSSYHVRLVNRGGIPTAEVGSDLNKAVMLERGTQKMLPRPHLIKAYKDTKYKVIAIMRRRWDQ